MNWKTQINWWLNGGGSDHQCGSYPVAPRDTFVNLPPFLARHLSGDWGELDSFDKRQNDTAVKEGLRILSAYDVPIGNGETERIWIITEADRSTTTVLTPTEY